MDYQVLLYYFYTDIEDPSAFKDAHKLFCDGLGLKGRILVSLEGINGTVSGLTKDTETYMDALRNDPLFKGIVFKVDPSSEHVFDKMKVRVRDELVNLSLEEDLDPREVTGRYVSPVDFYHQMQSEDTVVIDARNDYEFDLGHFKNAIRPDIEVFRDLPQWIEENEAILKDKRILTYCTGGVRCEKFSGWLVQKGYDDVGQLDGGIVTYGRDEAIMGKDWEGQCYVFDKRMSVPVNHVNESIVGKDYFTGEPCERYINCNNPNCHRQMLVLEKNESKYMGSCSDACRLHPNNLYTKAHNLSREYIEDLNTSLKSAL
ncbi:MAG: rhodanese-related sulfurtransferase [Erysipelothrix sp.]|nr:rhodanese-related sulfurtransferase [Erysipelothrix sp.]